MDETIVSYKCPNCAYALRYNAESADFVCDACSSSFTLEQVQNADVNREEAGFDWTTVGDNSEKEDLTGTHSYVCNFCGAEFVTEATCVATHCPYCDNVVVLTDGLSGGLRPNGIVPFKIDKKELKTRLDAYCKGKPLLPKDFIGAAVEKVQGLYVPFWLFDCHTDGTCTFKTTRTRMWSDSRYNYTETLHYFVTCDGEMSFEKIPVDASRKMDDALMDSLEPFDPAGIVPFDPAYLAGFVADRFDEDISASAPRATKRVKASTRNEFQKTLIGYSTVLPMGENLQMTESRVQYILLPLYLFRSRYKEKDYTFAVNGQTGKVVGNLPISAGKAWAWFAGLAVGITALFTLLLNLLG